MKTTTIPETCANCQRTIGLLETPMVYRPAPDQWHIVCPDCHAKFTGPSTVEPAPASVGQPSLPAAGSQSGDQMPGWVKRLIWTLFWLFIGGPLAIGLVVGGAIAAKSTWGNDGVVWVIVIGIFATVFLVSLGAEGQERPHPQGHRAKSQSIQPESPGKKP